MEVNVFAQHLPYLHPVQLHLFTSTLSVKQNGSLPPLILFRPCFSMLETMTLEAVYLFAL